MPPQSTAVIVTVGTGARPECRRDVVGAGREKLSVVTLPVMTVTLMVEFA
jgi:hypothetical protein